jgi:site-specific DNA recombinase
MRASTDEQHLSVPAQRACIRAWAASEHVVVVGWYADRGVCSVAPIEERPALRAALDALGAQGAGALVVARRDRIARDVVLAGEIEREVARAGARLVSATGEGNGDSPADAFLRTVIDGAAQYERGMIRARTRAALGRKAGAPGVGRRRSLRLCAAR